MNIDLISCASTSRDLNAQWLSSWWGDLRCFQEVGIGNCLSENIHFSPDLVQKPVSDETF